MNNNLNRVATRTTDLVFVWVAIIAAMLLMPGLFVVAKLIPPHWPSWDAATVAAFYQNHTMGVRTGVMMMMLAGGPLCIFIVAMWLVMRRIEQLNGFTQMLSMTMLFTSCVTVAVTFLLPATTFAVAAFRPERAPEITQFINDLSWFLFVYPTGPFEAQAVAMGVLFIQDKSPRPLIPRWVGWLTLWVAGLTLPVCLITYFKTGPFAWNGLISFWMVVVIFFSWQFLMYVYIIKAFIRMRKEDSATVPA